MESSLQCQQSSSGEEIRALVSGEFPDSLVGLEGGYGEVSVELRPDFREVDQLSPALFSDTEATPSEVRSPLLTKSVIAKTTP